MASAAALVALLSTLTFLSGGERHLAPPPVLVAETQDAQLRLITCGGEFSEAGRRYLDNVIVYATRPS